MSKSNTHNRPLSVLSYEQAPPETRAIFSDLKKQMKVVPNLYAVIGNSPTALKAILGFEQTLSRGNFSSMEAEALALAVSQANDCQYCLASHTTIAKQYGISEAETVNFRRGTSDNPKFAALTALAIALATNRGHASQATLDGFFNAGYSKAALVELIAYVALNTFHNYVNQIADTPLDWQPAPELS